ncbi:MAG: hypothetical protein AABX47_04115 [Nanoarchaeota archaeon]
MNHQLFVSATIESHQYLEWTGVRFERGDLIIDAHLGIAKIQIGSTTRKIDIQPTNYEDRGRRTMENFASAIRHEEVCYLTHEDLYANTALSVMLTRLDRWRYDPVQSF